EDELGPLCDVRSDGAGSGNVQGRERYLAAEASGLFRRGDVDERERGDLLAGELTLARQPLGELAADHAGGADDEYMHGGVSVWSWRRDWLELRLGRCQPLQDNWIIGNAPRRSQ